jgi:hypothetical protein
MLTVVAESTALPLQPRPSFEHAVRPLFEEFCYDCHQGDDAEVGLSLAQYQSGDEFQNYRKTWLKVVRRLRAGEMPPEDADQPSVEQRSRLINWLESKLQEFDCNGPRDPGRVTIRRLNRSEYRNTIRDLLGVEYDPDDTFPRDELAFGFDNNGDVLTLPPPLLEKYLDSAERISATAIVVPEMISSHTVHVDQSTWEGGYPFGSERQSRKLATKGAIQFKHEFNTAGQYLLRITASAEQAGDELAQMAVVSDQQRLKVFEVAADSEDPDSFTVEIELPSGSREFAIEFLNDYYNPEHPDLSRRDRNLHVHGLEFVGPLAEALADRPASHHRILWREPTPEQWEEGELWRPVVSELGQRLLLRAYRRPPLPAEIDRLSELVDRSRQNGDSFPRAMQLALQTVLVSPNFLFRGEWEPEEERAGETEPIDEFALASRLSYFLWSSMPDDELLGHAEAGSLRANLASQVVRMLADEKISELARNFGGQWLGTRSLVDARPDTRLYPDFDEALRAAMQTEADLLLADIIREDRSVITLLSADFSYLNERLASHYGIEGVLGDDFQRVGLSNSQRGGIITLGGVLTVTSLADRTSPSKRGKWILGQLLGDEPPPPPPGVAELSDPSTVVQGGSIRQRLESHRSNESCASCHKVMDPLGFALEHYDAIGRWRDSDGGRDSDGSSEIDDLGTLPDGRQFRGAGGLREILMAEQDAFRKTLVEKLLTYALGRGLEYYDQCVVAEIGGAMAAADDRFSSLVVAIVGSDPFQRRRPAAE